MAKTTKAYRRKVAFEAAEAAQLLLQEWTDALESPQARAKMQAFETVKAGISDACYGGKTWKEAVEVIPLTPQEAAAFEVVAAFWKRATCTQAERNKRAPK